MEWFYWIVIIFFVLSLISIGITAYRYRQYIQTGWIMFKMNRQFKQNSVPKHIEADSVSENQPQIKCDYCQKIVIQENAIKLKNKHFCSHNCMEASFALKR
jgi:hypothetical protein